MFEKLRLKDKVSPQHIQYVQQDLDTYVLTPEAGVVEQLSCLGVEGLQADFFG